MLLQDYGLIIIKGIYDSDYPTFLINHLNREFGRLKEQGYSINEFEHKMRKVIELIKNQIREIYDNDSVTYNKYKKEDKVQPKEKRYNYPKPDINEISILNIRYPSGSTNSLSGPTKKIYLKDIVEVEKALNELLNNGNESVKSEKIDEVNEWTNLTWLLHDYYKGGCKLLNKTKVIALSKREKLNQTQLMKKWSSLEENNTNSYVSHYKPTDNHISVKTFGKVYKQLMQYFESADKNAFINVENDYKGLTKKYPTYLE